MQASSGNAKEQLEVSSLDLLASYGVTSVFLWLAFSLPKCPTTLIKK